MSFEDQIGVSEPVTRLGSINGTGPVDGAAQHCASTPRPRRTQDYVVEPIAVRNG